MDKYSQWKADAFALIPVEFQQFIEGNAYERGHSAGQDEVDMIAASLAGDMKPHIDAYNKRMGINP